MTATKYYAMFQQLSNPGPLLNLRNSSGQTMLFNSDLEARSYVARNYDGSYNIVTKRLEVKIGSVHSSFDVVVTPH